MNPYSRDLQPCDFDLFRPNQKPADSLIRQDRYMSANRPARRIKQAPKALRAQTLAFQRQQFFELVMLLLLGACSTAALLIHLSY